MFKKMIAHPKAYFLVLTLAAATLMGWPHLNVQDILSQGDIGRDLYTFEQVWKGKLLYKDIWWVYGPLMPYVYGLFYLIFGFKITSILLAKFLLTALGGVFFFLASSLLMSPIWAFLATCFFLQSQQDFFFTYNHVGAITASLAVFWLILKYLKQSDIRYGLWAVASCLLLGLIKINFGLSALVATLTCIALIDFTNPSKNKQLFREETKPLHLGAIAVVASWIAIYGFLLGKLPLHEIRQCMPYFGDDQPYHRTIFETIPYFIKQHYLTLYHHWMNLQNVLINLNRDPSQLLAPLPLLMTSLVTLNFLTHPIIHGSTLFSLLFSFSQQFNDRRKQFWLTQAIIWIFFILNFHEFIVSGIWYRTYWSQPFHLFFSFFMIATAVSFAPQWLRAATISIWISFFILVNYVNSSTTKSSSTAAQFLTMPRGQVYVGNEAAWVDTVSHVTEYLNQHLTKDELFLALPYDCLYYYLTAKPSPTRQLIFFDHIKITPTQEASIIKELQQNKVNYILLSNRAQAGETGLGYIGKTYCPLIYQYLMENFTPVYRYGGNWEAEPGTNTNHGVIIFKKKLL